MNRLLGREKKKVLQPEARANKIVMRRNTYDHFIYRLYE